MKNCLAYVVLCVASGVGLAGLIGCQDAGTGTSPGGAVLAGAYAYTGYDSNGTVIVRGWLSIDSSSATQVTGEWHLQGQAQRTDIGPQTGYGNLKGSLRDTLLFVNLHPQMADNNVLLSGRFGAAAYRGRWDWVTFIGPTNHGTFEAIRK